MKTFKEWLNLFESMSVYVKGHDYSSDIHNLDDISARLKKHVIDPLWYKIPEEERDAVKNGGSVSHRIISPDGSYYSNGNPIINLYTAGWSQESIDKIIQGIKYFLDEMRVKYGPFKTESSGMYGGKVTRIPILDYSPTSNSPPLLNLSNANANLIFGDILGIQERGSISPAELIMRISKIDKDKISIHAQEPYSQQIPGRVTHIHGGIDEEGIKKRLNALQQIAKWAMDNHYDEIYVV